MNPASKLPSKIQLPLPGGDAPPIIFRRIVDIGEEATFRMGARGYSAVEEPIHRATLTEPYWMAETPVTNAQFASWTRCADYRQWFEEKKRLLFFEYSNRSHENRFSSKPQNPAEDLNWFEASAFCVWLTSKNKFQGSISEGVKSRIDLPTGAQWEYACRAGTDTEYWSGDGEAALDAVGWFVGNSGYETHSVSEKPQNPFGLYDMDGNVWEWCRDEWNDNTYPRRIDKNVNPLVVSKDLHSVQAPRIQCGGSCSHQARDCRSATRGWRWAGHRLGNYGFRVCLFPGSASLTKSRPIHEATAGRNEPTKVQRGGGDGLVSFRAASLPPISHSK